MSNTLISALSYLYNTSGISNSYSSSYTSSSTESFSSILEKLNNNIEKSSLSNEYGSISSSDSEDSEVTIDIDAIVNEIKNNKSSSVDVDSIVKKYLLANYGGSELAVIKNLSGASSLPTEVSSMQSQLFNNIVSNVSSKVREEMYADYKTESLYYSDDETDTESTDS